MIKQDRAMQRFSVFLTPAKEDFIYAESLIQRLSSEYDAAPFEPHVTVFSGDLDDPEALMSLLLRLTRGVKPFCLRVKGIGCSEEYFRTLFVEFEESPALQDIYRAVREGVQKESGYRLVPHMSLLYKEMPLTQKEALAKRVSFDREEVLFDCLKLVTPENRLEGWRDTACWKSLLRVSLSEWRIKAVLLDFGGVVAEEGFREGLFAIARSHGLDPHELHQAGLDLVYDSGYVLGTGTESDFWRMMRDRTGITGDDSALSREILDRFVLRRRVLEQVRKLRREGIETAILSDQTDWLARLDARDDFFKEFDYVFNSHDLGKGKRDPTMFADVLLSMGISPSEALFIDDMEANVNRARACGLRASLCKTEEQLLEELQRTPENPCRKRAETQRGR